MKDGALTFILARGIGRSFIARGVERSRRARLPDGGTRRLKGGVRQTMTEDLVDQPVGRRRDRGVLPRALGLLLGRRDGLHGGLAGPDAGARERRRRPGPDRQPAARHARALHRRDADRQQHRQHRRVGLHDERARRGVRRRGRDLRHGRHVDPRHHLRRGAAEDARDHLAGQGLAALRAAGLGHRRPVRAADARDREARARDAAPLRHHHRREPGDPLGHRGDPRPGRPAAQGGRRRQAPSATCSAASSTCATSPSPT